MQLDEMVKDQNRLLSITQVATLYEAKYKIITQRIQMYGNIQLQDAESSSKSYSTD